MKLKIIVAACALAAAGVAAPGVVVAQATVSPAAPAPLAGLISAQAASDRTNATLERVVRSAVARGAAERTSMSASKPIEAYLKNLEKEIMASEPAPRASQAPPLTADELPPLVKEDLLQWELERDLNAATPSPTSGVQPLTADDLPPLVERHLLLMEELEREIGAVDAARRAEVDAYAGAKANGVAVKLLTAAAIESWGRLVVIVPPGEVIENDPIDVAHAKLADLTRQREELQAELKTKPTSESMRSILRELAGIDRQINGVIFKITGVVWFHRAGKGSICHPKAVKGRPVAWYNCDYLALSTPFVVDPSGENIIVDRVLIDVSEDAGGLRGARIAYYTRAHGQPPSDESNAGVAGEFRYMPDGSLQLIVSEVDEAGEERERAYPIRLGTDEGQGLLPGFSGHGPFKLKFKRDPKAYISWEQAEAMSRGVVASAGASGGKGYSPPPAAGPVALDDIPPLVAPEPGPGDADYIPPLVEPEPGPGDADYIPPLVAPEPGPGDADYIPPLVAPDPGPGDDDYIAPLVSPN